MKEYQKDDKQGKYFGIGDPKAQDLTFKGELLEQGKADLEPSVDMWRNNPMKTPPNNLTSKNKTPNEKD